MYRLSICCIYYAFLTLLSIFNSPLSCASTAAGRKLSEWSCCCCWGQHKCQKATTAKHNKLAAVSKTRVRASTHELRTLRALCERERITIFIVAKNKSMQINYLLHFAGEHPPHSQQYYYYVYDYYCVLFVEQLMICICTNMFV